MTVAFAADAIVAWPERNQRWLVSRFAALRERIAGADGAPFSEAPEDDEDDFAPALQRCAELFGLSRFERDLLLLCAGVAIDAGLAGAVARAAGHAQGRPTFPFAMSLLEAPHWDALSPQAPLRHWQLLHLDGALPTEAGLRIDERMLHYLSGVAAIDQRLDGLVELVPPPEAESGSAAWIAQVLDAFARGGDGVQLQRAGHAPGRDEVMRLLAATGRQGLWVRDLPGDPATLASTLRLVDREAALAAALVVLDLRGQPMRLDHILSALRSPVLVLASPDCDVATADARLRSVWLPEATPASRARELATRAHRFGAALPAAVLEAAVSEACEQFAPPSGRALEDAARAVADAGSDNDASVRAWSALREHSREGLERLAQRIESVTTLDDLVLPAAHAGLLADLGRQLQQRRRVYRDWGFAGKGTRGLGIAALFTGESGTGKTMAAEALANGAGLDLYRIDLAGTVSKYIGETEKNLRRIFDAAEASGAVLLFDEADALFGKRSEVKDSHDRYANIETAYLLQRIEAYRGLAILTTNMKGAIDKAFLRRIRFVVQFPFPDEAARIELWRRQFPPQAPLHDDIRWPSLARLPLAGGNIRTVALNAAFLAAHEDVPIAQRHLAAAAHAELAKLERSPGPQAGANA
jgi:hypothetical protein